MKIREIAKITEARRNAEDLAESRAAQVSDVEALLAVRAGAQGGDARAHAPARPHPAHTTSPQATRADVSTKTALYESTRMEFNGFKRAAAAATVTASELRARSKISESELQVIVRAVRARVPTLQ